MNWLEYTVSPGDIGMSVEKLLRREFGISSALLRSLKTQPLGLTLDGSHTRSVDIPIAGQVLRAEKEAGDPISENIEPQEGQFDIIFEDADILVVNKDGGIAVHPSRGHQGGTLANHVAYYFRQKGENSVFRAVNRLDKGTSGLLCLAKNQYSAERLCKLMAKNKIKRTYLALLEGEGLPPDGVIDLPIARTPDMGIMRKVDEAGQSAITHFTVISVKSGRTLVEINLETGRTHQIRVHFSHLGYPVTGDFMYGTELPGLPCFCLHSAKLSITHPISGDKMDFAAPIPQYMERLITL